MTAGPSNPSRSRKRSLSVQSTSSLSSLSDSELSKLSESESEDDHVRAVKRLKPARIIRRTRSPSLSGSSGDEDAAGNIKANKKRYCLTGLYYSKPEQSEETCASVADISTEASTEDVDMAEASQEEPILQSVPLAVPHNAQVESLRTSKRASSLAASTRLARNGRGAPPLTRLPSQTNVVQTLTLMPKSKSVKKPTVRTSRPLGIPLFPETNNEFALAVLNRVQTFTLPEVLVKEFSALGMGRMKLIRRANTWREPPHYQYLTQNWYPERNKFRSELPAICQCSTKTGCDEHCINRLMLYLCSPKLCPAKSKCANLPFQLRDPLTLPDGSEGTEVFYTGSRGFGLRTLCDVPKDTFIMEYRGEVISREESYDRVSGIYLGRKDYYFLDYDGEEVIDAGMKGNDARFINHSCSPNCKMVRYRLADFDEWQIGLFSLRDIPRGAELTYDYGWVTFASLSEESGQPLDPAEQAKLSQPCYCGGEDCRGTLGGKKRPVEKKPKGRKK